MNRVKIQVPEAGTINAEYVDEWTTGATTYTVTAPHVAGAFVISTHHLSAETIDPDTPYVCVEFGRRLHPASSYYSSYEDRPDRPHVHGVPLTGAPVVDTRKMRAGRLTGATVSVRRRTGLGTSTSAPDATANRTAAVIHGLLAHWLTRPETLALRLAAAALAADRYTSERYADIAHRCDTIATARTELVELEDRAAAAAPLLSVPRPAGSTLTNAGPSRVGSSRRPGCATTGNGGNPRPPTIPRPPASPCRCTGAHEPTCPAVVCRQAADALAVALDQLAAAGELLTTMPAGSLPELDRLSRLCRRLDASAALARDVADYVDDQADAHDHHTPERTP